MSSPSPFTWFILGANSGFGQAVAQAALARGDRVLGSFRSSTAAETFRALSPQALAVVLDPAQPDAATVLEDALAPLDRLDAFLSCPGTAALAPAETTSDALWSELLEVNCLGPLRITRALLPRLRAQGHGHLLYVTAIAATVPEPGFAAYAGAKAALATALSCLSLEVAPLGLRVTQVVPGPFRTPFLAQQLRRTPVPVEYEKSVGKFGTLLSRIDGRQPGSPALAAQLLVELAGRADAPEWLPLGRYACDFTQRVGDKRRQELETWRTRSLATDGP